MDDVHFDHLIKSGPALLTPLGLSMLELAVSPGSSPFSLCLGADILCQAAPLWKCPPSEAPHQAALPSPTPRATYSSHLGSKSPHAATPANSLWSPPHPNWALAPAPQSCYSSNLGFDPHSGPMQHSCSHHRHLLCPLYIRSQGLNYSGREEEGLQCIFLNVFWTQKDLSWQYEDSKKISLILN